MPSTHIVGDSPERTKALSLFQFEYGKNSMPRGRNYGYLGLHDYSLFPVILPGSFLQIDPTETKIKTGVWRHELERPIYFIELREEYAWGWCELRDGHLILVPHTTTPQPIRRFSHLDEAEIIGRVTGVAMRIVGGGLAALSELPRGGDVSFGVARWDLTPRRAANWPQVSMSV
jgi:hypothetical protein